MHIFKWLIAPALAVALVIGVAADAQADRIGVVADVNAVGVGNIASGYYDAMLQGGTSVLFSRTDEQQGPLLGYYNGLAGVSATESAATLTAAVLAPLDLLVVTRFFNASLNYTAAEISAVADFVANGGNVLMITEASNPAAAGYNGFLSGIGSSISYTGDRFVVFEGGIAAEATALGPLGSFDADAYNTLSGGTAVYIPRNGTFVAYEDVNVIPEPSSVALLGLGALGLMVVRRKRKTLA